jgi:hypothetical protein
VTYGGNSSWDLILANTRFLKTQAEGLVVERFMSMCNALGSITSTKNNKNPS